MIRAVSFVVLCVGIVLSCSGCDNCPPTGYNDGYQAGSDYEAALVRASVEGTATPDQVTYILRYWHGDADMAAMLTGNFGSIDWEGDWSPGCSEYQWAWQLGWQDGSISGSQGAVPSGDG